MLLKDFVGKKGFSELINIAKSLGFCKSLDTKKCYLAAEAYRKNDTESEYIHVIKSLEKRWYSSLPNNPDYSVYNNHYYIIDIYNCWIVYSRKYLSQIQKVCLFGSTITIKNYISNGSAIIDLGCGMGLTTSTLKSIYPKKQVFGTNIETSFQYKIAEHFSKKYNFKIISDISLLPTNGTIFASEYFEHFQRPVEHLYQIIKQLRPKHLLIANTFNGDAIGHFNIYHHLNKKLSSKQMNIFFNKCLKSFGYKKVKTKLWNNRPALWTKI
tara:strand:- start:3645 stop:4451 length:807 start_codon:yes stop_codon:yes gene_type:complete